MPEACPNLGTTNPAGYTFQDESWQIVVKHDPVIQQCVNAAMGRGTITRQDREDAVSNGRLIAYTLANRPHRNFEHYLRRTLTQRFRFCLGTDALDRATSRDWLNNLADPKASQNDPDDIDRLEALKAPEPSEVHDEPEELARAREIRHYINSISVRGDWNRTRKLRRAGADLLLFGKTKREVMKSRKLGSETVAKILREAPARMDIRALIRSPQDQKIAQMFRERNDLFKHARRMHAKYIEDESASVADTNSVGTSIGWNQSHVAQ